MVVIHALRYILSVKFIEVFWKRFWISSMNYHNRLNVRYRTSKLCEARPVVSLPCLSFVLIISHSFSFFGFFIFLLETWGKLHVIFLLLMVLIWKLSFEGKHFSSSDFACLLSDQLLFWCVFLHLRILVFLNALHDILTWKWL